MIIKYNLDPSTANAPSGFFNDLAAVANLFDRLFTNNITIYIDVGWNSIGGEPLPSDAEGASVRNQDVTYTYAQIQDDDDRRGQERDQQTRQAVRQENDRRHGRR